MNCSLHDNSLCDIDKPALTWRQGWCRCYPAVGGQVFASCDRRTVEGNPSDTETASLLCLVSDQGHLLACPSLVPCPCCCFPFLFVSRMWVENNRTPAVSSGSHVLLNGNYNLGECFIKYHMKYHTFLSMGSKLSWHLLDGSIIQCNFLSFLPTKKLFYTYNYATELTFTPLTGHTHSTLLTMFSNSWIQICFLEMKSTVTYYIGQFYIYPYRDFSC